MVINLTLCDQQVWLKFNEATDGLICKADLWLIDYTLFLMEREVIVQSQPCHCLAQLVIIIERQS